LLFCTIHKNEVGEMMSLLQLFKL